MSVSDSGWSRRNLGRCLNRYTRVLTFDPKTPEAEILAEVADVKKQMCGQDQHVSGPVQEGNYLVVTFTDTVDSSD